MNNYAVIVNVDVMNPLHVGKVAHNNHVELLVVDGKAFTELTPDDANECFYKTAQYIFIVPSDIVSDMTSAHNLVASIIRYAGTENNSFTELSEE